MEYISSSGQHERARKNRMGKHTGDLPSQALREPACDDIAQQRHRGPHCGGVGREARAEESPLASSHSPHFSFSYGFRVCAQDGLPSLLVVGLFPLRVPAPPRVDFFFLFWKCLKRAPASLFFADLWHTFRFGPPPVLSTGVHQFVWARGGGGGRRNARHS